MSASEDCIIKVIPRGRHGAVRVMLGPLSFFAAMLMVGSSVTFVDSLIFYERASRDGSLPPSFFVGQMQVSAATLVAWLVALVFRCFWRAR